MILGKEGLPWVLCFSQEHGLAARGGQQEGVHWRDVPSTPPPVRLSRLTAWALLEAIGPNVLNGNTSLALAGRLRPLARHPLHGYRSVLAQGIWGASKRPMFLFHTDVSLSLCPPTSLSKMEKHTLNGD